MTRVGAQLLSGSPHLPHMAASVQRWTPIYLPCFAGFQLPDRQQAVGLLAEPLANTGQSRPVDGNWLYPHGD